MRRTLKNKLKKTGNQLCDICKEEHILQEHHIRGRKVPNHNHKSNLTYICANCHDKVHFGLIIIEGWYYTDKGLTLLHHKKDKESITGNDIKAYIKGEST